jgi:hypothetical protein
MYSANQVKTKTGVSVSRDYVKEISEARKAL